MTQSEILISIGGLVGHLSLDGAQPLFLDQLRARYGVFMMSVSPRVRRDFSLRLVFESAAPPGSSAQVPSRPLEVSASGTSIAIDRWDLRVRLRDAGNGRRLDYRGRGRCAMNPFTVDCILRVLWATLLPRVGGMLVHGCGLRHGEIGVVFPGPSGAGKTTLARKASQPDAVLSDELCVVRRADDCWRVHGTPFWGDFARGGTSMRSWPLRTVAFLAQATRDAVTMTPLVSSEGTLRLLACFTAFVTDRASVKRNLALTLDLCAEIRLVEASLTKRVPARDIFRRLGPHLGPELTREVPPASIREMISEFRSLLRQRQSYTFRPKRGPIGRLVRKGDALLVDVTGLRDVQPGDILLYWRPGAMPDSDTLLCRRQGNDAQHRPFGDQEAELLGKVVLVSRVGKQRPMPGRIDDLASVFGALVADPVLRTAER